MTEPAPHELEAVANKYDMTIVYNPTYGNFRISNIKTRWPITAYGRYDFNELTPERLEADILAKLDEEATPTDVESQQRRRSPITGRYLRGQ